MRDSVRHVQDRIETAEHGLQFHPQRVPGLTDRDVLGDHVGRPRFEAT